MTVTVLHGDCLAVLPTLAADSIDACVTDPPYDLAFMNKSWDRTSVAFKPTTWAAIYRVLKPGAHLLAFGGTRTYHRMACAIEDAGFEVRDCIMWIYGSGFPKSHDVSKAIDRAAGAEREVIARRSGTTKTFNIGATNVIKPRDPITAPATDAARQWQGWGTALKPACEPIIVARKPLSERTVAANVLKCGTGALNIDGCRIATNPDVDDPRLGGKGDWSTNKMARNVYEGGYAGIRTGSSQLGRWPANLIHDGSEEVTRLFPQTQSGALTADQQVNGGWSGTVNCYGTATRGGTNEYNANAGSAARFFYSAKADADDRLGSKHPTVKPVDLMAYLVRLVTPPGGTVLDPFAGSGSTGMACMREGIDCALIEREAEYVADINKRIAHVGGEDTPLLAAAEYDGQKDFSASLEEGYRAIRERMVAGGPGWMPRDPDDDLPRP